MTNELWYNISDSTEISKVNNDLGLTGIICLTLLIVTSLGLIYYASKKIGNDIVKVLGAGALVGGGYSGIKELTLDVTGIIKGSDNTAPSGSGSGSGSGSESGDQFISSGTGSKGQSTSSGSGSAGDYTSSGTGATKSLGLPLFLHSVLNRC